MGMYDSFIDHEGREWQTKELDCTLQIWRPEDKIESGCIPEQSIVNIRVYDYDESKKQLVYATAKVINGIVKSITPNKDTHETVSKINTVTAVPYTPKEK